MRAYPSAAYDAFSSLQHPTQSIPGQATIASSMGNAKSPATPKTLAMPISLSLDRTWSITVIDATCIAGSGPCDVSPVEAGRFGGVDTRDMLDLPTMSIVETDSWPSELLARSRECSSAGHSEPRLEAGRARGVRLAASDSSSRFCDRGHARLEALDFGRLLMSQRLCPIHDRFAVDHVL